MSGISIRPARAGEAPAILEVWTRSGSVVTVTDDERSIRALIEHDPEALLVAEQDGRLVGTLVAGFDGWRGIFYRLAVVPGERRRGIGRALVEAGKRSLKARGAARINTYAVTTEDEAMAFWNAVGFESDTRTSRFIKNLD